MRSSRPDGFGFDDAGFDAEDRIVDTGKRSEVVERIQEIDWAAIKEKAKMNGSLKNHAPTIISHLSSQELVDMHNKMPSEYKLKKEKYNRESTKSHTEAEMDKFLNSRYLY